MMVTLPSYDSTKVSSLSLNPGQFGTESGGVWTDQTFPYTAVSTTYMGISFDFSITNESDRGLSMAPRIPFTNATDDLAGTGETPETWGLTIATDLDTKSDLGLGILYGVATPNPDPWSDSNLPTTALGTTGSTFLIETIIGSVDTPTWVLSNGVYSLVWNLDFLTNYTDPVGGATVRNPLHTVVNHPLWNGTVQFVFLRLAFNSFVVTANTFAGSIHDWHTGMIGAPMQERGRVVHDFITGQPYMSTSAVKDAYRKGVMVHPDNQDPNDPLEEDPWTPPPHEGEIDDEIVDVE